ncbi:MAG: hypothetical protein JXA20_15425, partial [Spirochaetes bacterium]|nr:hypothetical protein [Spirochaetota bacterium]
TEIAVCVHLEQGQVSKDGLSSGGSFTKVLRVFVPVVVVTDPLVVMAGIRIRQGTFIEFMVFFF